VLAISYRTCGLQRTDWYVAHRSPTQPPQPWRRRITDHQNFRPTTAERGIALLPGPRRYRAVRRRARPGTRPRRRRYTRGCCGRRCGRFGVGVGVGVGVVAQSKDKRPDCSPLLPEGHSRIVGAGRGASFTYPIRVASPASVAGGIDIGTIVRRCHDQHGIAIDVDVG
jgi:hypothetical protein